MTAAELSRLVSCPCGAAPTAPLGELCPESDPTDPSFHDFAPDGPGVTLPALGPSGRALPNGGVK